MNHELIEKLKSLNPTFDLVVDEDGYLLINDVSVADLDGVDSDDRQLITLAPAMREELLRMEEEIKQIINRLPSNNDIERNGKKGGLRDEELQMYWEGAVWMRNRILKSLQKINK